MPVENRDQNQPELVINRELDAPRELVWKAWTEAERLAKWWGPKGFEMLRCSVDLRPGGLFHYGMRAPAGGPYPPGTEMWGKFVYVEIGAPGRLDFVSSFSNAQGGTLRHPMSATWPLETMNRLTLAENGGKTTLTLRGGPHNATDEERKTFAAALPNVQQGFQGTFEQLVAYLAEASGTAGREIVQTRLLDAPLDLVWKVWTESEHVAKWYGPRGFRVTVKSMEARVGGSFVFTMHGPNGVDYPNVITYRKLEKPTRMEFWHGSDREDDPGFEVTVTLTPEAGKTRLVMRSLFPSVAACDEVKSFGAVDLGAQTIDKLVEHLAALAH